ncbi:MAG TPA: superoxide dismutase family protein, partial [Mycobacterium sp.]|nr:superoxide dismutase family protein [Mycobacterium sp.]
MVKPSLALAALSVAALSACSSHQSSSTSSATSTAPGAQTLSAQLHTADGRSVATATFEFANGYATVTVKTTGDHILAPGFHKMHVHAVGKCEPNSVDPMRPDQRGDFLSAGMHFQAPGHTGEPMSGDLGTHQCGHPQLGLVADQRTRAVGLPRGGDRGRREPAHQLAGQL